MPVVAVTDPVPTGLIRVCAFTLSTALVWLGHECHGGCPAATASWSARVWCARVQPDPDARSVDTIVVVDFGARVAPPVVVRELLARVNTCVAGNRLQVREFTPAASGNLPGRTRSRPAS